MSNEVSTVSREEAHAALRQLKMFLDGGYHRAMEQGILPSNEDAIKILIWMRTLDYFLTSTPRAASSYATDLRAAQDVLDGGVWTMQLSDGGYSRLSVSLIDNRVWIDKELSRPRVLTRWATLGG